MSATLAVNLMAQDPPARFIETVKFVEAAGFSHMFVADSSLHARDVYPYMTLLATNTTSLRTGPLVTHPYTRHPAINLNALATINEISGGRVCINIGAGDRPVLELGYPMAKTKVLREAICVIRELQKGQAVHFAGETFRLEDAALRYGRPQDMPLYVTATGPKMLELAGEVGDGVLFFPGTDRRCVQYALDHIDSGARRAGRDGQGRFLACCVYGALDDDYARAREACLPIAAWFPQTSPQYAELIGVPAETIDRIRDVYSGGHFDESREAFRLVSDEMVEAFTMCGNAAHWIEKLQAIAAMGVSTIVIYPMVADKLGMIRRIADEVLPHFRG